MAEFPTNSMLKDEIKKNHLEKAIEKKSSQSVLTC